MADISSALRTYLLTKTAITNVIGDRMESDALSQGVAVPAVVYRRISTRHGDTINGSKAGIAWTRFEINSIAATRLVADQLAETIRLCGILDLARETLSGVVVQGVVIDAGIRHHIEGPDEGDHQRRYVTSQDYQIAFNEDV